MFARRRTPPEPVPNAAPGVHAEVIAVASPDGPSIERERALRFATGRQLQGVSGYVVGHDRGDPSLTFERVVSPVHDPTKGLARVGFRDGMVFAETANDAGTTDPEMTAFQAAMLARIAR